MTQPAPDRGYHPEPVPPAPVGACSCCGGPLGDCCKLGIAACCGCWAGDCPRCNPWWVPVIADMTTGPTPAELAAGIELAGELAAGPFLYTSPGGLVAEGYLSPGGPGANLAAALSAELEGGPFGFGPRRRKYTWAEFACLAWAAWRARVRRWFR